MELVGALAIWGMPAVSVSILAKIWELWGRQVL
jgi:hypothetical protein